MLSFKEQISNDLNIFINPLEFAATHTIDNRKINIVIDDDKLEERNSKGFNGLTYGDVLYYVKADDYGDLPSVNDVQKFDGKLMYVVNAVADNSIYEITLSQNRSE